MNNTRVFKHPALPFVECRYSKNSLRQYKPHIHNTFSIGAIEQGEVTYQIEGQAVKLRPGSLALINPETLHSCNPAISKQRSYYVLHLDIEWCYQRQNSLWRLDRFHPVEVNLIEDGIMYHQYISTMRYLMTGAGLNKKEDLLSDLVEQVFLLACQPNHTPGLPSLQIEKTKRQLSIDLDKDISLKQVAAEQQANPFTLMRQFKAATGITPYAYRLNCKIEMAKKLLGKGYEPSQVALECGFFDQSHLHRHFKAITTLTPKEYQVNFVQ